MASSGRGWIVKPVTCGLPAALRSVQCGFGPVQPVQGALPSWAHKCSVSRAPLYWFSNSGEVSHFCPVKTSNNDKPCHPFHGHSLPLILKDLVRLKGRGSILNPWRCESCHVLFPVWLEFLAGSRGGMSGQHSCVLVQTAQCCGTAKCTSLLSLIQELRELILKYRQDIISVRTAADHLEEKLKAEILFLKEQIQAEQYLKENIEETLQLEIENCKEEIGEQEWNSLKIGI